MSFRNNEYLCKVFVPIHAVNVELFHWIIKNFAPAGGMRGKVRKSPESAGFSSL